VLRIVGEVMRPRRTALHLRDHYLVVEARAPDGGPVEVTVTPEEDGEARRLSRFAVKGAGGVYIAVERDRRDDGVLQNDRPRREARRRARPRLRHAGLRRRHRPVVSSMADQNPADPTRAHPTRPPARYPPHLGTGSPPLRELAAGSPDPALRERLLAELDAASRPRGDEAAALARMADEAERKAAQAAADRDEKRRPYEADPLFMYLWRRRFGTKAYRAFSPVRYLDRKVAHLVGYEGARANYATLLALPDRLAEHAARLRARAAGDDAVAEIAARPEIRALLEDAARSPDPARRALPARIAPEGGAG
jgi:hypothetical protein